MQISLPQSNCTHLSFSSHTLLKVRFVGCSGIWKTPPLLKMDLLTHSTSPHCVLKSLKSALKTRKFSIELSRKIKKNIYILNFPSPFYAESPRLQDKGPKQVRWFQRFVVMIIPMKHRNGADNQNDSSVLLLSSFWWNARIVLQVKCCYRFVVVSWAEPAIYSTQFRYSSTKR